MNDKNLDPEKIVALYKTVFNSFEGKIILHDLMKSNYVFTPTFSQNMYEMAMNEGKRELVLRIMTILNIDPEKLLNKNSREEATHV